MKKGNKPTAPNDQMHHIKWVWVWSGLVWLD